MNETITQFNEQMPLILRLFENCLRSGYNLVQSFDIIAKDLSEPASSQFGQLLTEIKGGTPLPAALSNWLNRFPSRDLDLMLATLQVQFEVGSNLADKLNLLAQIMSKRAIA